MKKTPTEITAFWFGVITVFVCTPLAYFLGVLTLPSSFLEWSVVAIVGIFSVLGQIAFTLALKIEKAGPVSVAQTLNIVIVLFYQIVFFHESVTLTSLVGVFLIILSVMIIGFKDLLSDTQLIKQTVKKFSKSSNGQFNINNINKLNSSNQDQNIKKEKDRNDFILNNSIPMNFGIKVLPSSNQQLNEQQSNQSTNFKNSTIASSVCIAGNCKTNICFNSNETLEPNLKLNLQTDGPPKYVSYKKNDIF